MIEVYDKPVYIDAIGSEACVVRSTYEDGSIKLGLETKTRYAVAPISVFLSKSMMRTLGKNQIFIKTEGEMPLMEESLGRAKIFKYIRKVKWYGKIYKVMSLTNKKRMEVKYGSKPSHR